jgi:hypothetical protein
MRSIRTPVAEMHPPWRVRRLDSRAGGPAARMIAESFADLPR